MTSSFLPPAGWTGLGSAGALGAGAGGAGGLSTLLGGPVGIALGAGQAILGIMGGRAQAAAQQQNYVNQVAFQNATSEFNLWNASRQAAIQNLNNEYSHWAQGIQYRNNFAQVQANRNYEFAKEIAQADVVAQTRASAGASYLVNSDAIAAQLEERGMQESMALMMQKRRALQSSAAVQVMGQEGKSLDSLERDYAFQLGEYTTIASINEGIRNRQYRRDQYANIANYLSQYNSQQFYQPQKFMDPIAPFAPLPTLINPPPPSFTGSGPADMSGLNVATSVLGGVNTAVGIGNSISKL